jgi:hypothetical protein
VGDGSPRSDFPFRDARSSISEMNWLNDGSEHFLCGSCGSADVLYDLGSMVGRVRGYDPGVDDLLSRLQACVHRSDNKDSSLDKQICHRWCLETSQIPKVEKTTYGVSRQQSRNEAATLNSEVVIAISCM